MMPTNRRRFLAAGAAMGLGCAAWPSKLFAQRIDSPSESTPDELVTEETQHAIDRGLAYLAHRQIVSGRQKGAFGTGGYSGGVAVCGLSGLAFMCGGSSPGQGPYGKNVDHCVDFLVENTADTGYINSPGNADNMYGHGFATLFLAEAYGMGLHTDREAKVGDALRRAVKLIIETQNDYGGWRYQPIKSDADLSITICQIMALRGARDAGIHVPDETRAKCIEYVKKSQNTDGGFRYTIGGGGSTFPLTAAGIVSLYSAGIYDGEPIEKGLAHLKRYMPGKGSGETSYYFYAHYYAVQAMWHAGGDNWEQWYTAIRDTLLSKQNSDGSWTDSQVGPEFGTAMACIILQMPYNYVPVFAP